MPELMLTEIWIYPIKSMGGIRLTKAKVMEKGLEYDRRWMLVDELGKFLTQRNHREMAHFKLSIDKDELTITHKRKGTTHIIPLQSTVTNVEEEVVIWDDNVKAFEVSETSNKWFSDLLNINCRLVFFPEENIRAVDTRFANNQENVSLSDGYPFLIIGEASLNDLNNRMKVPLPMNRFRPNFVFSGGEAFEEDCWRQFNIGSNKFLGVKPCARCVVTTINQETIEKGDEPLRTLATYRKRENKIYFGQNVLAVDHTFVCEGDTIIVNSSGESLLALSMK
jgi:uncharacterized protein